MFRDRKTLLMLFGMPIVQIVLFGFALTNEIKNARVAVLDLSKDAASQELLTKIEASRYFEIERSLTNYSQIETAFRRGDVKAAIVIPTNFGADLSHQNNAQLQIVADASDPNTASTLTNYLSVIVADYNQSLVYNAKPPLQIKTEIRMLYNPQLKGAPNFVPGVMALVLMLICVLMTSISIVREKELGTMEILLVSPFKPFMVIVAKAVPYFVLSLVNVTAILLLSVFLLDVPIKGSVVLLFAESMLFILTALSLGLLISTRTNSQQTAMLISLMGMMLPTVLFTGYMFPIENMPKVLQWISNAVPSRWYYSIVKNVMIKGLGFEAVWKQTAVLVGMTMFFMLVALKNFKTRLA